MFVAVDGSPTGIIAAGLFYSVFGILISLSDHRRAAMAGSSVTVVTNANRLRFFRTKLAKEAGQ
jgi:cation transport ATPase